MMTLENAILHLEETLADTTKEWSCAECKQEHQQLYEWLKELKFRRDSEILFNTQLIRSGRVVPDILQGWRYVEDNNDI